MKTINFGKRVRERRKALGLTQSDLADRLGYTSKAAVSRIETGVNGVPLYQIPKLAEALNTTEAYLLDIDEAGEYAKDGSLRPVKLGTVSVFNAEGASVQTAMKEATSAIVILNSSVASVAGGDIVTMRRQAVFKNGDPVVCHIDGQLWVKRYFKDYQGKLILRSDSSRDCDLDAGSHDVQILGRALSVEKTLS